MKTLRLFVVCLILSGLGQLRLMAHNVQAQLTTKEVIMPRMSHPANGAFHSDGKVSLEFGRSILQNRNCVIRLEKWADVTGKPYVHNPETRQEPAVLAGLARDGQPFSELLARHGKQMPKGVLGDEGYVLQVTPKQIVLAAYKPAGIYYGVLQLIALNTAPAPAISVSDGTVVDWPAMRLRGIHVSVGSKADIPFVEQLITQYMPELRLNQLVLEVDYHFQYKTHPKMDDPEGLSITDCAELKKLADANYIRIIPMIDCLGHQSWAAHTNRLLREYPQFDETPNVPADNSGIYCRSWCPSNPEVYHVVDDLIGELVDAFHADAFNVGMDEVFLLGECPLCKGTPNDALFARAVNNLHDYIVGKRHIKMLMWADRFLDGNVTGYGRWEASANGTAPAINLVPHDIIMCDWHYESTYNGKPADFPSVSYFEQKGFRVWPTGWNSVDAVHRLITISLQTKSPLMLGYMASTWIGIESVVNGLSGDPSALSDSGTKKVISGIREGALMAWQGDEQHEPAE